MKTEEKALKAYIDRYDAYQEARVIMAQNGARVARDCRERIGLRVTYAYMSAVENGREALTPEVARRMLELSLRGLIDG